MASRAQTEAEWERRLGVRSAPDEGLGYWIGSAAEEPVGWWGLGHAADQPGSGELGFRLLPAFWR